MMYFNMYSHQYELNGNVFFLRKIVSQKNGTLFFKKCLTFSK